ASLRLVAPANEARVLADFREEKIALIQRSMATPAGGVDAEVVVLEDGEGKLLAELKIPVPPTPPSPNGRRWTYRGGARR
ncbi:MAG TPA: hypothetical protein PKK92_05405, partial [Methanothrix sp.]|nr:hypothetical protein [Methanothrix sp.]